MEVVRLRTATPIQKLRPMDEISTGCRFRAVYGGTGGSLGTACRSGRTVGRTRRRRGATEDELPLAELAPPLTTRGEVRDTSTAVSVDATLMSEEALVLRDAESGFGEEHTGAGSIDVAPDEVH